MWTAGGWISKGSGFSSSYNGCLCLALCRVIVNIIQSSLAYSWRHQKTTKGKTSTIEQNSMRKKSFLTDSTWCAGWPTGESQKQTMTGIYSDTATPFAMVDLRIMVFVTITTYFKTNGSEYLWWLCHIFWTQSDVGKGNQRQKWNTRPFITLQFSTDLQGFAIWQIP